jgi:hypothetical protein
VGRADSRRVLILTRKRIRRPPLEADPAVLKQVGIAKRGPVN